MAATQTDTPTTKASDALKQHLAQSKLEAIKEADALASAIARGEMTIAKNTTSQVEKIIHTAEWTWSDLQENVERHEKIAQRQQQLLDQRRIDRETLAPMRAEREKLTAELSALRAEVNHKQQRVDQISHALEHAVVATGLSNAESELRNDLLPAHVKAELARLKAERLSLTPRWQELERRLLKVPGDEGITRELSELRQELARLEQRGQELKCTYLPPELISEREDRRASQRASEARRAVEDRLEKIDHAITKLDKRRPGLVDQRKTFAAMPEQLRELNREITEIDSELESLRSQREVAQTELGQIGCKPPAVASGASEQSSDEVNDAAAGLTTKAIQRMKIDELQQIAKELGIESTDESTVKQLRAAIIEHIEQPAGE